MNLSLYNIQQEYIVLAESIIENGGELTEELQEALKINKDQLEKKGQSYGFVIRQLDKECDIIDSEIKRLQNLKSAREKTIDRLKESIFKAMELYEIEKIESPTLKISFRKSESVEVENVNLLDKEYTKTTIMADKAKIKEAIKNGEEVVGATIKQSKNIQIK